VNAAKTCSIPHAIMQKNRIVKESLGSTSRGGNHKGEKW